MARRGARAARRRVAARSITVLVTVLVGALASTAAARTFAPTVAGAADQAVAIQDFEFQPARIEVAAGTRVVWTNEGASTHTVTSDDGLFLSDEIGEGGTFDRVFDDPGSFAYHCSFHSAMVGTVVVAARQSTTTTSGTVPTSTDTGPTTSLSVPEKLGDTGASSTTVGLIAFFVVLLGGVLIAVTARRPSLKPVTLSSTAPRPARRRR